MPTSVLLHQFQVDMEDGLDQEGGHHACPSLRLCYLHGITYVLLPFPAPQQIQEDMEDGLDKKGDNKDFEEKLAEQLFADESKAKIQVRGIGL